MLNIRLDKHTELRLERLCNQTGHAKSYYLHRALEVFLDEQEDYLLGIAVSERQEPTIKLGDLEKSLRLNG